MGDDEGVRMRQAAERIAYTPPIDGYAAIFASPSSNVSAAFADTGDTHRLLRILTEDQPKLLGVRARWTRMLATSWRQAVVGGVVLAVACVRWAPR